MFWKWMAAATSWLRMGRAHSRSTSTENPSTTPSTTSDPLPTESGSTFWQRVTEIFNCRLLATLKKDLQVEREARLTLQGQVICQRSEIERLSEMLAESL